jgi:predicted acetyltransferase
MLRLVADGAMTYPDGHEREMAKWSHARTARARQCAEQEQREGLADHDPQRSTMALVELELLELDRTAPYTQHDGFNADWWRPRAGDNYTHLQVHLDGVEVARVLLDEVVHIEYYVDTPPLGATALQIELIEVSDKHRRQGMGREVVHRLAQLRPDRRLVAFSEGADKFWESLKWRRHKRRVEPERSQPLFIQPPP